VTKEIDAGEIREPEGNEMRGISDEIYLRRVTKETVEIVELSGAI
jgi:hypothetical protein